jgi:hypothetical protein
MPIGEHDPGDKDVAQIVADSKTSALFARACRPEYAQTGEERRSEAVRKYINLNLGGAPLKNLR